MVHNPSQYRPDSAEFSGFDPLEANYVYCPNQFLDLCIPNYSRGCVRVVSYILRQTLGWLDSQGNPLTQDIHVTWNQLIRHAGVSRGAVSAAVREGIQGGFLRQIQQGRSSQHGKASVSNVLALKWSDLTEYHQNVQTFDGFFRGVGHRTPIPNAFFDRIVSSEPLAVTKVVGAVLRHTVGYQTQFGGRRQSAPLSYRFIADYANLSTGRVLANALTTAINRGYVQCLATGNFHSNASNRAASQYTVRWRTEVMNKEGSSKKPSANDETMSRFKKAISTGSESPSEDRFKKTTKEKTVKKETDKQQVAVDETSVIAALLREGMDRQTAQLLVKEHGAKNASQQLAWLNDRNPKKNRVGLLRKAIEEKWSAPAAVQRKQERRETQTRFKERQRREQIEDQRIAEQKRRRAQRRHRLIEEWGSADLEKRRQWIENAAKRQTSQMIADLIRRENPKNAKPMMQILDAVAIGQNLPPVSETVFDEPFAAS